ncbi:MTOR-associated protein MEAK7 isoform X3 [Stigmatopora nigra]
MGNAESAVVQKRLTRFRPEHRPMIEGVFDRLRGNVVAQKLTENTLTFEMLQSSMCILTKDSMIRRSYQSMCSIAFEPTRKSAKVSMTAASGVHREQLVIFLADTLQGTAEEQAPLVMAMCQNEAFDKVVTNEQVTEMLVAEGLAVWQNSQPVQPILPPCQETSWKDLLSLLDIPTLMFLAAQLPDRYSAPWRLVFSTLVHGESFTRMIAGLRKCGPTLLLIKDTRGYVFGGFASISWEVKPEFQGDSRCFLFSVFPRLSVYSATGYNQHFMYLNQNQHTMPNGLGMGGQHSYFGLWLDSDFGHGHSRARPKCTTFGSPQLSGDENFILDSMEIWAVGKASEPDEEEEAHINKSVMDKVPEVQSMMEMTGKKLHSLGLREPHEN